MRIKCNCKIYNIQVFMIHTQFAPEQSQLNEYYSQKGIVQIKADKRRDVLAHDAGKRYGIRCRILSIIYTFFFIVNLFYICFNNYYTHDKYRKTYFF